MPSKEEIAKQFIQEQEKANPIFDDNDVSVQNQNSIGPPIVHTKYTAENDHMMDSMGWKKIPLENLPTQGSFYPDGTYIEIKPATVSEIRHFSTLDENDFYEVTDTLNMVIEKCCRIKIPNKMGTYRDLKETDRFYLLFCIREITFVNGENKLFVDVEDPQTGEIEKVELTKDKFSYYSISPQLMEYYSPEEKCFVFRTKSSGIIRIYVPSIGVSNFMYTTLKDRVNKREFYDKVFVKIAPFVFSDWRTMSAQTYKQAESESITWDAKKVSVVTGLIEKIELGVQLEIKHTCKSGAEVTTPMKFPGGLKSLFLISDIFGELL